MLAAWSYGPLPRAWRAASDGDPLRGAHAGQRTMDVDAPAFRGASLVGAIIAVAVYAVLMFFILRRPPGKRGKPKKNEPAPTAPPPPPPPPPDVPRSA